MNPSDPRLSGPTNSHARFVAEICTANGTPEPVNELQFHPSRKWRFDFAWPDHKIALEVEGGAFVRGRHSRGSGFLADMDKYNAAAALGWRVFRCTPQGLVRGGILSLIHDVLLAARGNMG